MSDVIMSALISGLFAVAISLISIIASHKKLTRELKEAQEELKEAQKERDRRDAERERKDAERDKAREEISIITLEATNASIALGEATARAVQRIPDAHCNGDMHKALEYAEAVKHKQRDFLTCSGVKYLHEYD